MRAAETPPSSCDFRPGKTEAKKIPARAARPTAALCFGFIFFLTTRPIALSQEAAAPPDAHVHHLGFLIGPVYNLHEKSTLLGLGLEYERRLPVWNSLLGIGIAGEMVFDEHKHYVVSLLICFHPAGPLTLSVAPGVMFIDRNGTGSHAAIHLGAEYEFEVGRVSLAPTAEAGFAGDDVHLMLGFHLGFGF
jgi:hypothetical protein